MHQSNSHQIDFPVVISSEILASNYDEYLMSDIEDWHLFVVSMKKKVLRIIHFHFEAFYFRHANVFSSSIFSQFDENIADRMISSLPSSLCGLLVN